MTTLDLCTVNAAASELCMIGLRLIADLGADTSDAAYATRKNAHRLHAVAQLLRAPRVCEATPAAVAFASGELRKSVRADHRDAADWLDAL